MSVAQPLLDTIEPDEPLESSVNTKRPATAPVVLTPTNATQIQNDPEAGQSPVNRINPLTTNFLSQALWGYFDRYILISTTFHNFTAFILVGPSHGSLLLIPVPRSSYNRLYSMWMVYRQLCSFGTHPPPSLPIKLSFLVVDRCRGSPLSYGLLELPSEHTTHEHLSCRSSVSPTERFRTDTGWTSLLESSVSTSRLPHSIFRLFSLGRRRWRELLGI